MATRYVLDFGSANAGGNPTFTLFARLDTLASVTAPTITEIPGGSGEYYFDWDWTGLDYASVTFKATLNGVELADVIASGGVAPGPSASAGQWTREDILAYVKHLLFEDASTTSIGSLANLQSTVDVANKTVWQLAVRTAPSLFETRTGDITYNANTGYYDLTQLESGNGVYMLSRAWIKWSGYWYPLEPMDTNDRVRVIPEGVQGVVPLGYYLEGEKLYLVPKPSDNQTLQFTYIPNLGTMTTGTAALNGVRSLSMFHPLVAYEAAIVLGLKDEGDMRGLIGIRNEMRANMLQHLSRRNLRRPRVIREVPFR